MIKKLTLPLLPALFLAITLLMAQQPAVADPVDVTPLPPVTDPNGRMGVCYGFYEEPQDSGDRPYLDLMYDAGARHDRWDFSWWAIQPDNQDQWNWSGHETIVQAENAKGVDVLGILLWTPQWASTHSGLMDQPEFAPSLGPGGARSSAHADNPLMPMGPMPSTPT